MPRVNPPFQVEEVDKLTLELPILSREHYATLKDGEWVDGGVIYAYPFVIREESKDPEIKTHPRHFLSGMWYDQELCKSKGYKFMAGRPLFRQVGSLFCHDQS